MKGVIEEHLNVIRGIDEGRSDGYNLLLRYRDFVAGGKWDAFFDFALGYSHYLMHDLHQATRQNRRHRARAFTVRNLEELIMRTNKPLSPILQSMGFKNIARAIRLSTISLQYLGRKQSPYEIRYGLASMPAGRRQMERTLQFERAIEEKLEGRVLSFDQAAAEEAATLMATRQHSGRTGEVRDTMIAGIALAQRATLATRNERHFDDLSVPVVNPWQT